MKFAACGLVAAASLIASTSAQCTSHLSCAELNSLHGGWPTGRGSALVCGESDNGIALDADSEFTGCFGGSAVGLDDGHTRTVVPAPVEGWEDGSIICRAMGARLCTVEELGADETRGTGCQHDAEWLWSSEVCGDGDGHLTAVGSTAWGSELCPDDCAADPCTCPARCANNDDTTVAVRCCADTVPDPANVCYSSRRDECSALSCAELTAAYGGWPVGRGDRNVCGESDNGLVASGSCVGGSDVGVEDGHTRTVAIEAHDGYVHAKSICTSIGARLCTVAELNAQETRGSGCQHDAEWLWTTQRCNDVSIESAMETNVRRCCTRLYPIIPPCAPMDPLLKKHHLVGP